MTTQLTLATWDGPNRLITLNDNITQIDAAALYSEWKLWCLNYDGTKYPQFFSVLGGDPLPGGRYLGTTFFLENTKIRPYEGNHTLVLSGNLYDRSGGDPFVNTIGNYNVRIMLSVSNLVDTVNVSGGGGASASDIWNYSSRTLTTAIPSASDVADAVRTELTPELTQIMALQNGLTGAQATMLTELFNLMGLDPTKPLVVTKTSRTAGAGIQQTIAGDSNTTVVTRV